MLRWSTTELLSTEKAETGNFSPPRHTTPRVCAGFPSHLGSCRRRPWPQSVNQPQDFAEQVSRHYGATRSCSCLAAKSASVKQPNIIDYKLVPRPAGTARRTPENRGKTRKTVKNRGNPRVPAESAKSIKFCPYTPFGGCGAGSPCSIMQGRNWARSNFVRRASAVPGAITPPGTKKS